MMKLFFLLFLSLTLLSCSTTQKSATSKTTEIYGAGVIHKPVLVDLDVKETKVVGTFTVTEGGNVDAGKQLSVADALKKANADVLVEPTFVTETSGGRTIITVSGFPANYKNFRPLTKEDIPLLSVGVTQKATVYEPSASTKKKTKAGLIIAGAVAVLVVTAAKLSGL